MHTPDLFSWYTILEEKKIEPEISIFNIFKMGKIQFGAIFKSLTFQLAFFNIFKFAKIKFL